MSTLNFTLVKKPDFPKSFIPLALSLAFWVADFSSILSNKGKFQYLPLLALLAFCLHELNRGNFKTIQMSWANLWFILYLTFGVGGILIGKLYFGATYGPLPIVLPWLLLCFTLVEFKNPASFHRIVTYISYLCLAGNLLVVLTRTRAIPILDLFQFSHENSYLIPLALGSAVVVRNYKLLFYQVVSVCLMFYFYPAGTYLLVFICSLFFFLLYQVSSQNFTVQLTMIMQILVQLIYVYFVTFNFGFFVSSSSTIFRFLGKEDNTLYRKYLAEYLMIRFYEQPIFGSGFTGEILVRTGFSLLPAHNDYLTILVAGGVVGLLFLLLTIFSIQIAAVRNLARFSVIDRKIVFILLCTVNCYTISMAINPIGMKTFNSLILVSSLFFIRSLTNSYQINKDPNHGF